jgi:hypothetical protein
MPVNNGLRTMVKLAEIADYLRRNCGNIKM